VFASVFVSSLNAKKSFKFGISSDVLIAGIGCCLERKTADIN